MSIFPVGALITPAEFQHGPHKNLSTKPDNGPRLPLFTSSNPRKMSSYRLTKRGIRILALVILAFIASVALVFQQDLLGQRLPPLYKQFRKQEQHLTHYNEYEKKPIKYLWAANHAHSSGWGNVMQDIIMVALLAHETKRSYVFDDYIWRKDGTIYSDFNGKLIPSRIPLSALVGGPLVGGEFPDGDDAPRAVSKDYFNKVCPNPTIIDTSIINTEHVRFDDDVSALQVFNLWLDKINSMDDDCIELDVHSNTIFEFWIFGNRKRVLSVFPLLVHNPVVTNWGWSPLVYAAYESNRHLFQPSSSLPAVFRSPEEDYNQPIPGLLALHVRRGDFENHCQHLANWSADWNAWNTLPELPDTFVRPTDGGWGETSEANMNMYIQRCYPSIEQIVEKVKAVVAASVDPLRYVYIMTNGAVPWVEELKTSIKSSGNWDHVGSSRDLQLTWEEKYVAHGLDMFVASRAQILIGNGWSSLTSNVVLLRLAHNMSLESNRFW
ncbi:hypothetical protein SERLA73DRAFT_187410 [Serpula lacrymans var. lacrymans S7.3]|uniref:Uncharacterized protein n=2 Tax=Serpula lacrymans var. lacrymans TaxID=341189 RepID=F8Q947_SERL3|nr:uncharacterized protein SERLADRAFT_476930 [Serpula lacrymans var. lacrymans S7.9]EGN95102.1 hypothetical protein SERLA73DRAFT_187410 [Serpula lacrymans var. lacrymans S7.3]EGO20588.1 hypothetical protein SERLADRAFT_476930 [Serpula lacrymans var. lacrymans S7.9]